MKCKKCPAFSKCTVLYDSSACILLRKTYAEIQTNADHIRSMSNEELAIYLSENSWDCNDCKSGQENMDNPFATRCDEKCAEHCLKWLQKPYKGE